MSDVNRALIERLYGGPRSPPPHAHGTPRRRASPRADSADRQAPVRYSSSPPPPRLVAVGAPAHGVEYFGSEDQRPPELSDRDASAT
ncbi:MAG TPA: hypothetical protein VHE14_05655 [Solirubrobacteraceae bacterium]|nr:hypothetical protein [Solirubrobacteraceae bacterium]